MTRALVPFKPKKAGAKKKKAASRKPKPYGPWKKNPKRKTCPSKTLLQTNKEVQVTRNGKKVWRAVFKCGRDLFIKRRTPSGGFGRRKIPKSAPMRNRKR